MVVGGNGKFNDKIDTVAKNLLQKFISQISPSACPRNYHTKLLPQSPNFINSGAKKKTRILRLTDTPLPAPPITYGF